LNTSFIQTTSRVPVQVADTVGEGDAFTAAFVHGLSLDWPPAQIAAL
jgi:sugar/nucleoside kinase (ribokinase family)